MTLFTHFGVCIVDIANLTPEERSVLRQLAESFGWALFMEYLFIPRIQQITQLLDRPTIEQSGHADYIRGEKHAYITQLDFLYKATGLPNPLDAHALGLLKAVARRSEEEISVSKSHIVRGGVALCGAQDGQMISAGAAENDHPTCEMCYTISQEIRLRRGRGRATLV